MRRGRHPETAAALGPLRPITVRIPDACRMTGIGRSKLYELIKAGDIATLKVGTITLIPVATLEAFVAGLDGAVSQSAHRPPAARVPLR